MSKLNKITSKAKSPNKIFFFKYVASCFSALLFDYSLYLLLIKYGKISQHIAGTFSYFSGLFVAYFLIKISGNFQYSLTKKNINDFNLFLASGIVGTFLTYISLRTHEFFFESQYLQGKILATGISFFIVYLFRKKYIYST
jgi:hypothetical protein